MDATRISDGRVVIMKRVQRDSEELRIMQYFSQEDSRTDGRNHCVPILDMLDPGIGDDVLVVLPLLRNFDDPKFESVENAVDFVKQVLGVDLYIFTSPIGRCSMLTLDDIV